MGYVELCVFRRLSLSLLSGADLNAIAADTGSFLTAYIVIPWFFIMMYGWKWYKKTRFVRLDDIDFDSGKRQRESNVGIAISPVAQLLTPFDPPQLTRWRSKSGRGTRHRRPGTRSCGTLLCNLPPLVVYGLIPYAFAYREGRREKGRTPSLLASYLSLLDLATLISHTCIARASLYAMNH